MRLATAFLLPLLACSACASTTGLDGMDEDTFSTNTLAAYDEESDDGTLGFWSVTLGKLVASGNGDALHSRLIRRDATILDGRVEIDTNHISNGLIIFRRQDASTFYYVAVRDDEVSYINMPLRNLELYRVVAGDETSLGSVNLDFPRGVQRTIAVEFVGSTITLRYDGEVVGIAEDTGIASAGGIGVGHDDQLIAGEASYFDALRWTTLTD